MDWIALIAIFGGVYLMAAPLWQKFFEWIGNLSSGDSTEETVSGLVYE